MGIYYTWVNVDKKEYIDPYDFGCTLKVWDTIYADNILLGALYSLLNKEWKGDAVIWLGDEFTIKKDDDNHLLQRLRKAMHESGYYDNDFVGDYIDEHYKDISSLFVDAEPVVRRKIRDMIENPGIDDYGWDYLILDQENPFKGLFTRNPEFFRYTINHAKKEFFDLDKTKDVLGFLQGGDYKHNPTQINPLVILMAFRGTGVTGNGLWIGDPVEVSNELPPKDYADMSKVYIKGYFRL